MKKILVVLLILAVTGGVFAQGEWSVSGNVRLGAKIDFIVDEALTEASANFPLYEEKGGRSVPFFSGDGNQAELNLNYKNGGFSGGLEFRHNSSIKAKMGFVGDRYELGAAGKLNTLIGQALLGIYNTGATTYSQYANLANGEGAIYNGGLEAWGNYLFLDGLVKMTIGVNKDYAPGWGSNNAFLINSVAKDTIMARQGDFYASINTRSGLVTEMILPGINFGVMLRSNKLETYTPFFWNMNHNLLVAGVPLDLNGTAAGTSTNKLDFMEDVLKKMIIGVKFDLQPIDIAAQFNVERLGAYLGLNWAFTDVIKAGLSFMGEFEDGDPDTDNIYAAFGASVGYDTGIFGLTLKVGYGYNGAVANNEGTEDPGTVFTVAPEVYYKVIPSHLYAKLGTKFEFGYDGFGWEFVPQIVWNFKGDGATDDPGTGIILKYTLAKPYERNADGELKTLAEGTSNAFVGFRWNF